MATSYPRDNGMFFSRRSRFIVVALQYNFVAFIVIAIPLFCYFYFRLRPSVLIDEKIAFNLSTAVALLVMVPRQFLAWLSILVNLWPVRPDQYRKSAKTRSFSRLLICLASKGDNIDAVERTLKSMRGWQTLHASLSFHILTEEPKLEAFKARFASYSDVSLVGVPKSFSPRRAKYKARALEYFRVHSKLTSSDWVLHLDEETFVDAYALETCLDVIERSRVDYAQGYIFYNNHAYWRHWLLTLGDVVRVSEDLGRYQWQASSFGRPLFGVHGAFLLINGDVQNTVTWDTDNLAEDFWFSQRANKLGFRFSWIPAIAREQSPTSINDYIRQRRRWWVGASALDGPGAYTIIICSSWMLIGDILSHLWYFVQGPGVRMPRWLWGVQSFDWAISLYGSALSLFIQDLDASVDWRTMVVHQVMGVMVMPLTRALDYISVLSAIVDATTGFDVIVKVRCWDDAAVKLNRPIHGRARQLGCRQIQEEVNPIALDDSLHLKALSIEIDTLREMTAKELPCLFRSLPLPIFRLVSASANSGSWCEENMNN